MFDETKVLQFLEVAAGQPDIGLLNRLIRAYVRKVPWESAFRIAKRAMTSDLSLCPRWPGEFWRDAMVSGGGGTCFESNYAFFHLLQKLGYSGYLTVNDMGEQRGCHSAIILYLGGKKVLVDVGIPLQAALNIDPGGAARRKTWLHTYTIRPDGAGRYQVLRSNHPKPNIYTLLDMPVAEAAYRQVVGQDYGEAGLFLDRVILVKVIGDRLWRFNSAETPYRLESFTRYDRQELPISPGEVTKRLAERFHMDEGRLGTALRVVSERR